MTVVAMPVTRLRAVSNHQVDTQHEMQAGRTPMPLRAARP